MPVAEAVAYFDHAAVSPLPEPTRQAVRDWVDQAACQGVLVWNQWADNLEKVRVQAAGMLAADATEIAFVPNTSSGIQLVAEGFPWREGDNLVTLENEFPSNLYPWMNLKDRGVETRMVAVEETVPDLDQLLEACDHRTRLITVSWVSFCTGWRLNIAELVEQAHRRGILVFLDAIQGLGVFPLDLQSVEVDFLAADGHKWLLAPEGAGIFYLRREHLQLLRPLSAGWNSVEHASQFDRIEWRPRESAVRYEGGSQNMVGITALGASLQLLSDCGLAAQSSRLAERVLEITDHACQRLEHLGATIISRREGEGRSGIVSFDLPGKNLPAVRRHCMQKNIALSCRNGLLRISPHAYVDEEDISRLIDALSDV
ncbi:MAG: aminotransferase class V-fold PLP-dependent enzyme [Pirellulaceae bacterium]